MFGIFVDSKLRSFEPLINHEIPNMPWHKLGCDLFDYRCEKYLLVIDYYSKYVEMENLRNDTTSQNVIEN